MLGPGLIGGSVLRAVRSRFPEVELFAWARRTEAVENLRGETGLVDLATDSVSDAVEGAECVILAMPTGAMGSVVQSVDAFADGKDVLVTDVGSVKAPVVDEIGPLVRERGGDFIGSHPMAGSEKTGIEFADSNLFEGAAVILTPPDGRGEGAAGESPRLHDLREFWNSLGARVSTMPADRHDHLVASISHLPHLLAAALARSVLAADADAGAFCGGGFRDTTRVAAGPEDMWSGILEDNRVAVLEELEGLIDELGQWKSALADLDSDRLHSFLSEARRLREKI